MNWQALIAFLLAGCFLGAELCTRFWLDSVPLRQIFFPLLSILGSFAGCAYPPMVLAFRPRAGKIQRGSLLAVCGFSSLAAVRQAIISAAVIYMMVLSDSGVTIALLVTFLFALASLFLSLLVAGLSFFELIKSTRPLLAHYLLLGVLVAILFVLWVVSKVVVQTLGSVIFVLLFDLPGQVDLLLSTGPLVVLLARSLLDGSYLHKEAVLSAVFSSMQGGSVFGSAIVNGADIITGAKSWDHSVRFVFLLIVAVVFVCHIISSFGTARRFLQSTYSPLPPETNLKSIQGGSGIEN